MKPLEKLNHVFRMPVLTWPRMGAALTVAVIADGLQLCLGFFGWAFGDQIIDAVTMVMETWLLGFHILLLPTFVAELIPLIDDLPTWTACVIAVITLRKRAQKTPPTAQPSKPVIDI